MRRTCTKGLFGAGQRSYFGQVFNHFGECGNNVGHGKRARELRPSTTSCQGTKPAAYSTRRIPKQHQTNYIDLSFIIPADRLYHDVRACNGFIPARSFPLVEPHTRVLSVWISRLQERFTALHACGSPGDTCD